MAAPLLMHATIQLSPGGRVVIPARMRQALHLVDGSRMVLTFDPERRRLVLVPVDEALDLLQDQAAALLGGLPSLSEALLADRRAEVAGG
jgi:bifunctional DNA-binding transcriptional regulator/antitoxin component of YhaV-PrlF toxin-antitoxin module